jgi:hypothetical protein
VLCFSRMNSAILKVWVVAIHPNKNNPDDSQSGQQAGTAVEHHSCQ